MTEKKEAQSNGLFGFIRSSFSVNKNISREAEKVKRESVDQYNERMKKNPRAGHICQMCGHFFLHNDYVKEGVVSEEEGIKCNRCIEAIKRSERGIG